MLRSGGPRRRSLPANQRFVAFDSWSYILPSLPAMVLTFYLILSEYIEKLSRKISLDFEFFIMNDHINYLFSTPENQSTPSTQPSWTNTASSKILWRQNQRWRRSKITIPWSFWWTHVLTSLRLKWLWSSFTILTSPKWIPSSGTNPRKFLGIGMLDYTSIEQLLNLKVVGSRNPWTGQIWVIF